MKKNIFIILNPDYLVEEWQYKCLLKIKNQNLVFLIANELKGKDNSKLEKNYLKNFLYYIVNIVSIRQKQVRIHLLKKSFLKEKLILGKS